MTKRVGYCLGVLGLFLVSIQNLSAGDKRYNALPAIATSGTTALSQLQAIRHEMKSEDNTYLGRAVVYSACSGACLATPVAGWLTLFAGPIEAANAYDRIHRDYRKKIQKIDQAILLLKTVIHLHSKSLTDQEGRIDADSIPKGFILDTLAELNVQNDSLEELIQWIVQANRGGMKDILLKNPPTSEFYSHYKDANWPGWKVNFFLYPDYLGLTKAFLLQARQTAIEEGVKQQTAEALQVVGQNFGPAQ